MRRPATALLALLLIPLAAAGIAGNSLPDVPLQAWVTLDAAGQASHIEWDEPTNPKLQAGAEPLLRALRFSAPVPGTAGVRTHLRGMLRLKSEGDDVVLHLEEPGAGPKLRRVLPPRYPASALRGRQEGHVVALFDVGPTGEPTALQLQPSPGSEAFVATVREALSQWRFEAEQRAGQPIAARVCAPFRFTIARRKGEPEALPCPVLEGRIAVAGEVQPLPEIEVTASRGL